MRFLFVCLAAAVFGCSGSNDNTDGDQTPINPGEADAGTTTPPSPDAAMSVGEKPAGAACTTGAECAGGTCLGAPGQPEADNVRFVGGYCTSIGCTPNTQEGCGADEFCVETGDPAVLQGGYCVEVCSKADGLVCDRADHVCLGLGFLGGCFSQSAVTCDRKEKTGCDFTKQICVKIGFEDDSPLGRCETKCDPVGDTSLCHSNQSCYYIKAYNDSFCALTGTTQPEESCACDKCCIDGYACTPDTDGSGRHCKKYCTVDDPHECGSADTCVPIEISTDPEKPYVSRVGGCVTPGSAGTPR